MAQGSYRYSRSEKRTKLLTRWSINLRSINHSELM